MSQEQDTAVRQRALEDLLSKIDKDCSIHPHAQQLLLDIADDFIDSVTEFSCQLAKHRKSKVLETKDLKLCLEKNWGIHIPGFGALDLQPPPSTTSATHQKRVNIKRKATEISEQETEDQS
jgi:transcription initiation factor TFIID subunit 12